MGNRKNRKFMREPWPGTSWLLPVALMIGMSALSPNAGANALDGSVVPIALRVAEKAADTVVPPVTETPAPKASEETTQGAAPKEGANVRSPWFRALTVNGDLFMGMSNTTGIYRRSNDGLWAGYGTFIPSTLSVNWRNDSGRAFRLSLGLGDMFTGAGTYLRQPVELYYQAPVRGGGTLTTGKFYVPFASNEWVYETKWGMMYQGNIGRANIATAITYNNLSNSANAYMRVGRTWNARTTLGVSAGVGRGMMYGTSHGAGMGVDFGHDFGAVMLNSEYNFSNGANGLFQFAAGKLTFTRCGNFMPYMGVYYWGDKAQELGGFRSMLAGMAVRLNRFVTLDGAYARSDNRNVFWMQTRLNF